MICPVCRKAMIVVEHHQIEIDYCHNCSGAWFDSGELELLLESVKRDSPDLAMPEITSLPEVKSSHRRLKCPICGRNMRETAIGAPPIHIDVCHSGDGLWFDGGELHELVNQLADQPSTGASSGQPIITFLREVFKVPE